MGEENPWHNAIAGLRVRDDHPHRQPTTWQYWLTGNKEQVCAIYDQRITTSAKTGIGLRSDIACELFENLAAEEQAKWEERANKDWEEKQAEYAAADKGKPSCDPTIQKQ